MRSLLCAVTLALGALGLSACVSPPTPIERLSNNAYEVASALRFGRVDIASEHVAAASKEEFIARHSAWTKRARVVDLEMTGLRMAASDDATVNIQIAWQWHDGASLHTTEISQHWRSDTGSFRMVSESFVSGDRSLFDLPKPKKEGDPAESPGAAAPPARMPRMTKHVIREE